MKELYLLYMAVTLAWDVDIKNKCRNGDLFHARASFNMAARELIEPQPSLKTIGEYLNGKDHATVLHSCKMYNNYLLIKRFKKIDTEVRKKFQEFRHQYKNLSLIAIEGKIDSEKENILIRSVELEMELENLKMQNYILMEKNNKLSKAFEKDLDPFIIEIMQEPKHIRDEFNLTRWQIFKKMLQSRKTYPILNGKQLNT